MSSFDNSLFSNSINEAVSRQNTAARVEETLEKHKMGIINAKEQLQAIAEGKWNQIGDMTAQGLIDAGLRGHGMAKLGERVGNTGTKLAGRLTESAKKKLMKSKVGKLGSKVISELSPEEQTEIRASVEKDGVRGGVKTFVNQRVKKGAKSFLNKFKSKHDEIFNGDNPEMEEGGDGSVRVRPTLAELHKKYSADDINLHNQRGERFNQYDDDMADRARLRSLAKEEDWDARANSLHQAVEQKIDGEPPAHVQDTANIKQQQEGGPGDGEQQAREGGAKAQVAVKAEQDEERNTGAKPVGNDIEDEEANAMRKDINAENKMAETGDEDEGGGLGALLVDGIILAGGLGVMAVTNWITGGQAKKDQADAEQKQQQAQKDAQTAALKSEPSISTQYGV
tara:strand:- start:464 stop:1651 length:1188 start_codon:yes stop_codon:yes gene_type:complete